MFANKTYLVSGAGGLLGVSVVESLLQAGATVLAADIDVENLHSKLKAKGIKLNSSTLKTMEFNIQDKFSIKSVLNSVELLDGAVNCAYPRNKQYGTHFYDVELSSFNENVSLNLGSSFLFMQQCAEYFKQKKAPFSLVNISSIYGVVAPKFSIYSNTKMTMPVEYAAIKSALQHLTRYVVNYVGNSQFRVNCVSPGGLEDGQPEAFQHKYREHTLGKGMLGAEDIVGCIHFLLSEQAKYINGQNLIVDDGFTN